jgi:hypothetical protein
MSFKKLLKKIEDWYEKPYKNLNDPNYINIGGLEGIEIVKKSEIKNKK